MTNLKLSTDYKFEERWKSFFICVSLCCLRLDRGILEHIWEEAGYYSWYWHWCHINIYIEIFEEKGIKAGLPTTAIASTICWVDDDGSGTTALLSIARAFSIANSKGFKPKRSLVFMTVSGEEKGLLGSKYYTDMNPTFPLDQTIANLNIDMIGRVDDAHGDNENYIYLIGSDKLSTQLHELSLQTTFCDDISSTPAVR